MGDTSPAGEHGVRMPGSHARRLVAGARIVVGLGAADWVLSEAGTPAEWRFALASDLLAHFGAELASQGLDRVAVTVLALGLLTATPILVHVIWKRLRGRISNRRAR